MTGFFISTMVVLLLRFCAPLSKAPCDLAVSSSEFRVSGSRFNSKLLTPLCLFLRPCWSLFGLDQPAVSPIAIGVIFRFPAAAYGDRCGHVELEDVRRDAGNRVRTVAERGVLRARAAAISDLLRDLFHDHRLDEIFIG